MGANNAPRTGYGNPGPIVFVWMTLNLIWRLGARGHKSERLASPVLKFF